MCAAPKPVKSDSLPIDAVLPALLSALAAHGLAVLQAPPGAGKTTRVPLAMLAAGAVVGKIIMLEPRRLAVRAAAERMAHSLGEQPGQTVGCDVLNKEMRTLEIDGVNFLENEKQLENRTLCLKEMLTNQIQKHTKKMV